MCLESLHLAANTIQGKKKRKTRFSWTVPNFVPTSNPDEL